MLGIATRKVSKEVATVVAEVLYDDLIKRKELMPDKMAYVSRAHTLDKFNTNSEWSKYTLDMFEDLDLSSPALERVDYQKIVKELIGIANFWKLACSL